MISKGGQKLNLTQQKLSEDSNELTAYCQKNPNIIELDISNNNFKAFPKAFLQFKKLASLDLRNNPFENFEETVDLLSEFSNLTDLKIDITEQNQVLIILSQIPKLSLLNGNSTKDTVTVVDLDEKEIENISLQHEIAKYNEIVSQLNNAYQVKSSEFVNEYQEKLNEEAEKIKSCLSNNVPNYIYAANVIQSQLITQHCLCKRLSLFVGTLSPEGGKIVQMVCDSIFKSAESSIDIINNLYPKIEEKTETMRNQLEEALKAVDEVEDFEGKIKIVNREKDTITKQFQSDRDMYLSKIERLESENKMMTEKLIKNAKDIIHLTTNKPIPSNKTIVTNHSNQANTVQNQPNHKSEGPNAYLQGSHTKSNQGQTNNLQQSQSNISNQITSSNMIGPTSSKTLTVKMMKDIMNEIFSSKIDFDKRYIDNKLPRETMEQHMYTYLTQKYGLKNMIIEWASSIINGIKLYSSDDSDINLFGKILRNEQEEDSRLILLKLRNTVLELIEYYLKSKNPHKSSKDIKAMVEAKKEGVLNEEEWRGIIYYIYDHDEASSLESRLNVFVGKFNENNNHQSDKKLSREELYNLSKLKEEMNILYKDFIKIISDHQIKTRDKYLKNFLKIFRQCDEDCDGVVNETEFVKLIKMIPYCKDNLDNYTFKFLSIIDPFNNKRITFSECVSLFSMEIINENDLNEPQISLLDKISQEKI